MANKMITMEIDGRTVQVPEGMNLVDAAQSVGVHIPNLCHLEHMRGVGACRMCVVEVEGMKAPNTACTMKTKDGLKITTDSDQLKKLRKMVIDLLVSMHPLDCMTCPKAGVCWLQDLAYKLDVRESDFSRKSFNYAVDDANGFIERDPNYCILCGKCVRVCTAQNTNILEFMGRGVGAKVTTDQDKPLHETQCTFCGSCLDACPVNAILESGRRAKGREWDFIKADTVCTLCGSACNLEVSEKDGEVIKVTSPKPNGFICAVGRFAHDSLDAKTRVRVPMIRKGGQLQEVSWEEALNAVSEKMTAAKKAPAKAGVLASAAVTNEDAYMLQKLGRAVIGTGNVDSTASLYDTATLPAYTKVFGKVPEADVCLSEADVIVTLGVNSSQWNRTLPAIDAKIRKQVSGGAKLIVLDPADSRLSQVATKHLKVSEGADSAALAALAGALVQGGLLAKSRELKAKGLTDVKAAAKTADVAALSGDAGLSADDVKEAAELIAKAAVPVVVYSTGVSAKDNGSDVVVQALNLAALTGGQVLPVGLEANMLGTLTMGLSPQTLPGFATDGKKLAKAWKVELPKTGGMSAREMLSGGLEFLYAVGNIPVEGKKKPAAFTVAQVSHMNPLAEVADVVLPAPAFVEQEGSIIDYYGELKMLWAAVDPLMDVMAPWQIAAELANRTGYKTKVETLDDVMDEVEKFAMPPSKTVQQAHVVTPSRGKGRGLGATGSMMALSGSLIEASRVSTLLRQTVSV